MQEGRILVVENKLKKWRTGSRKQQKKREKKKFKELQEKNKFKTDWMFSYAFRRQNNQALKKY